MSTRSRLTARRPSLLAATGDLDVTPVMNMFIILIPFLVSMAVFAHLAAHRLALPADDGADRARTAAELPLTIVVTPDRLTLAWGGREVAHASTGHQGELARLLDVERARRPEVGAVVVAVDDAVACAAIVRVLDACRDAGFEDVGLADATARDRILPEVSS